MSKYFGIPETVSEDEIKAMESSIAKLPSDTRPLESDHDAMRVGHSRRPRPVIVGSDESLACYSSMEAFAADVDEAEFPVKDRALKWASRVMLDYNVGKRDALEEQQRPSGVLVKIVDGITVYRRDVVNGMRAEEWYVEVCGALAKVTGLSPRTWPDNLKEALVEAYNKNQGGESDDLSIMV